MKNNLIHIYKRMYSAFLPNLNISSTCALPSRSLGLVACMVVDTNYVCRWNKAADFLTLKPEEVTKTPGKQLSSKEKSSIKNRLSVCTHTSTKPNMLKQVRHLVSMHTLVSRCALKGRILRALRSQCGKLQFRGCSCKTNYFCIRDLIQR